MRQVLVGSWNQRGVLALLLWPVSIIFGALTALRRGLYRVGILKIERVGVPVVVVGNVVAGGAGKTPVVIALVNHLRTRGLKAGVVSRGYGRKGLDCREVIEGSLASDVGDEPILIKQKTGVPVYVAAARIEAARALLSRHTDVDILVCDDGLQHYGMHRDIEICVFDERGIGNGFLLPAGPLREPWRRRTDLVLSSAKSRPANGFAMRRALATHASRADGQLIALENLRDANKRLGTQLFAVAGIARPEAFFDMLRAVGLPLACTRALPDHADFEGTEWPAAENHILLCTEKDAMKLWHWRPDALAVPLLLQLEPAFWEAFDKLVNAATGAKLSSSDGHTTS